MVLPGRNVRVSSHIGEDWPETEQICDISDRFSVHFGSRRFLLIEVLIGVKKLINHIDLVDQRPAFSNK